MIGENFRKIIEASGYTLPEFANRINVSTGTIYNLVKRDSIDSKYLEAAAKELGVGVSMFFEYEPDTSKIPIADKTAKKDRSEEINSVVENLQGIIQSLEKDKEELRRDKEFLKDMLSKAMTLKDSMGKHKGSATERLSQASKEAPRPGRAQSARKAVVGERATTA